MTEGIVALTLQARPILHFSQRELGAFLGLSRRTIQRWDSGKARPSPGELQKLAVAVHPKDPALATKLARAAGTTLEALGLVQPPPAPRPPPPAPAAPAPAAPALSTKHLVDIVVCAAAEALDVAPPAVRPVLLAAFRKAREVGLRVEDVEKALEPRPDVAGKPRAKNRR